MQRWTSQAGARAPKQPKHRFPELLVASRSFIEQRLALLSLAAYKGEPAFCTENISVSYVHLPWYLKSKEQATELDHSSCGAGWLSNRNSWKPGSAWEEAVFI